jgi:hypothetical protein
LQSFPAMTCSLQSNHAGRLRLIFAIILTLAGSAHAQHLWWNTKDVPGATCLYGEITVLATYPSIYYCGANWHPGQPAGGYCGIQDNSLAERRTIFSVWDTSPALHPMVTQWDDRVLHSRFGGEGEGAHTHMILAWKTGEPFRFIVTKLPGQTPGTTDVRYTIFDRATGKWRIFATINSPDGPYPSVTTLGGGLASFLENFLRKNTDVPRLATYRLWLGRDAAGMTCLTKATGDGRWGELNNAYFLAAGDDDKLQKTFDSLAPQYGQPLFGEKGAHLPPIPDQPVPPDVIAAITNPPVVPVR